MYDGVDDHLHEYLLIELRHAGYKVITATLRAKAEAKAAGVSVWSEGKPVVTRYVFPTEKEAPAAERAKMKAAKGSKLESVAFDLVGKDEERRR